MNWIVLLSVLVVGGGIFYALFGIFNRNQLAFYRARKHSEFDKLIGDLGVDFSGVKIFTDGHPYYWVVSSIDEVRKSIDRSCLGPRTAATESSLVLKSDRDMKHIYVYSERNSNVAKKLKHYER